MANELTGIRTGKWAVGRDRESDDTVLRFEFSGEQPLVLLVSRRNAAEIANTILQQYTHTHRPRH